MKTLATLLANQGNCTRISFDPGDLKPLAENGLVDAYIVATEDGFSPLGRARGFLSTDLGIADGEIRELADWNRFRNPDVSLIAFPSRRQGSLLRGLILAASESSECYRQFAEPYYGRPYRDFYYNVTYEAIAYANTHWDARHIAMSHLSAANRFHPDIATCNAEALSHFCETAPTTNVDSFMFLGCCIGEEHLGEISQLNSKGDRNRHRNIGTEIESHEGYDLIKLKWAHK